MCVTCVFVCVCVHNILLYIPSARYAHTLVEFVSFYTDGKKSLSVLLLVIFILCRYYYIDIALLNTFHKFLCRSLRIQTCATPLKRRYSYPNTHRSRGLRVRMEINNYYILSTDKMCKTTLRKLKNRPSLIKGRWRLTTGPRLLQRFRAQV